MNKLEIHGTYGQFLLMQQWKEKRSKILERETDINACYVVQQKI